MKLPLLVAIVLIVLLLAVVAVLRARLRASADSSVSWPFVVRKPMSTPEQILYFRLLHALPDHIVLAQVQLSRFLGVKKGTPARAWLNRINRLSVDFLVLTKDATVVVAIELDDKTHQRNDRREADRRKNRALEAADVRLIRWNVSELAERRGNSYRTESKLGQGAGRDRSRRTCRAGTFARGVAWRLRESRSGAARRSDDQAQRTSNR